MHRKIIYAIGLFLLSVPCRAALVFVSSTSAKVTGGVATTVTSPSYTVTNTQSLILVKCESDYGDSNGGLISAPSTTSGLTLTQATQTVNVSVGGATGVWSACTGAGGFTSKTFTCNFPTGGSPSIFVGEWTGSACTNANSALGIGAKAWQIKSTGQPTINCVTTVNNSWVIGAGLDAVTNAPVTAGSNQFLAYLNRDATDNVTDWVVHQNAATATAGTSVQMNVSGITGGDDWNMVCVEILPASGAATSTPTLKIQNSKLTIFNSKLTIKN